MLERNRWLAVPRFCGSQTLEYWALPRLAAIFLSALAGGIVCACSPPALGQALHTVDAIVADARPRRLDAQQVQFQVGDESQLIPLERLVRWGSWPGVRREQAVWLLDGSWLCGEVTFTDNDQLAVRGDWFQEVAVPLTLIRGVVLMPPGTLGAWNNLEAAMRAAEGQKDLIWLRGQSRLAGVLRWNTSEAETSFELESGGPTTSLSMDDVRAIVFSPALTGPLAEAMLGYQVGLTDGSLFNVRSLTSDAQSVRLSLQCGLVLASHDRPSRFSQALAILTGQPSGSISLGSVAPASYRHLSDSTLQWPLGVNRDVHLNPLVSRGGQVFRGLALHGPAQVAYRWDGAPGRLLAEVQLAEPRPTAHPGLGSARCQVLLAVGGTLEKVWEFEFQQGGEPSQQRQIIDIPLRGARLVVLVVEAADFGSYADEVLWLNARFATEGPQANLGE